MKEVLPFNKKVISGLTWNGASQLFQQLSRFVLLILLIKFLSPSDFGTFAAAMVVISLPIIFIDNLVSIIIINKEKFSPTFLNTCFWTSVCSGFFLTIGISLFSDVFAVFFKEPSLAFLLKILSLSFLLSGILQVFEALQRKKLRFELLAKIEIASFLAGTVTVLLLIGVDYGIWSLVGQMLVTYLVNTVGLIFFSKWYPKIEFNTTEFWEIISFSKKLLGVRFLNYSMRNIDDIIVGRYFGIYSLGLYDRAYKLVHLPMRLITDRFNQVLIPLYSSSQNNKEQTVGLFLNTWFLTSLIYIPLLFLAILVSDIFILSFFGEEWMQMAILLKILILGGIFHALSLLNEGVFIGKGKVKELLQINLITRTLIIPGYLIGALFGLEGLAIGYSIASAVSVFYESYKTCVLLDIKKYILVKLTLIASFIGFAVFVLIFILKERLMDGKDLVSGIMLTFLYVFFFSGILLLFKKRLTKMVRVGIGEKF